MTWSAHPLCVTLNGVLQLAPGDLPVQETGLFDLAIVQHGVFTIGNCHHQGSRVSGDRAPPSSMP
jgi:hypothetical protein